MKAVVRKAVIQARYEKRKESNREFTVRKRAGLLTPEEREADERRLEHQREWMKEWRAKRKASQPKKTRKRSLEELSKLYREGADLTPEEIERLTAYKQRKAEDAKRFREKKRAEQPKKRTLKELAQCSEAGLPLTPEEAEQLDAHRNKKKAVLQDLKVRAATAPSAAAELARQRAQQSETTDALTSIPLNQPLIVLAAELNTDEMSFHRSDTHEDTLLTAALESPKKFV